MKVTDKFIYKGTEYFVCDIYEGKVYTERVSDGRFKAFNLEDVEKLA